MANIDNILSREVDNKNVIYLYSCGECWRAYEHSAYHFTAIFQMGDIEQKDGFICMKISNQFEFLDSQVICSLNIISVSDDEVRIDCGATFNGFEQWKKQLIN